MIKKLFYCNYNLSKIYFKAHIVCKELGFERALNFTTESFFGPVTGSRFSMDNVKCRGDEMSIVDCPHDDDDDCSDLEGAGVICDPTIQVQNIPTSTLNGHIVQTTATTATTTTATPTSK